MEIILTYVSIWVPALLAVLATVSSVIVAMAKTKSAIDEFRNSTEVKSLASEVKHLASENAELTRTNKLLLDEITKIKDYAENTNKHRK